MRQLTRLGGVALGVSIIAVAALVLLRSMPGPTSDVGAVSPSPAPSQEARPSGSTPSPEPTRPPDSLPPDPPSPMEHGLTCGTYYSEVVQDGRYLDPEFLTEKSTAVVTGNVLTVGEGQWATTDGQPPDEVRVDGLPPSARHVFHAVSFELTEVGKRPSGDDRFAAGSTIDVRVHGGKLGCLTMLFSNAFDFVVGTEVALFLGEQDSVPAAPDIDLIGVFSIEDGQVMTPEGQWSVEEVLDLADAQ